MGRRKRRKRTVQPVTPADEVATGVAPTNPNVSPTPTPPPYLGGQGTGVFADPSKRVAQTRAGKHGRLPKVRDFAHSGQRRKALNLGQVKSFRRTSTQIPAQHAITSAMLKTGKIMKKGRAKV